MRLRFNALGGLTAGLAASALPVVGRLDLAVSAGAVGLAIGLAALAPRRWLIVAVTVAAVALGLGAGALRLSAIDREVAVGAAAVDARGARSAQLSGYVEAISRSSTSGLLGLRVESGRGRFLVVGPPQLDNPIGVGQAILAEGSLRAPEDWERSRLRADGIGAVLEADQVTASGVWRGGLVGALDSARHRAEVAVGRGMAPTEATLARGFVLGEDADIPEATRERFRRSGLAHLLAVSGQNVLLLVALATPILALLGVPYRARLWVLIALVLIYLPIAGGGPSIQRAALMGIAGLVAALADRAPTRWYVIGLAAALTLLANPLNGFDIGWQLSFAAVVGIALWTPGLARAFAKPLRINEETPRAAPRRALAEAAALSLAATIATAPLLAHYFGTFTPLALLANLAALPAVASVMWIGMIDSLLGQFGTIGVDAAALLNHVASALIAYIEAIAAAAAEPTWAQVEVGDFGLGYLLLAGAALLAGGWAIESALARRRGFSAARPLRSAAAAIALLLLASALALGVRSSGGGAGSAAIGLRISVLDVGQGDSILLDPPDGAPILVDTGPPGGEIAAQLYAHQVERLRALVLTHDQSDHDGALDQVLAATEVGWLGYSRVGAEPRSFARAEGARLRVLSAGDWIRSGSLEMQVLWPPPALLDPSAKPASIDPNRLSLVLLARFHGFRMLLTGDAESELTSIDPGPIDVLKLAHHGSEDTGLAALLAHSAPRLALISVGADNPYGHPTPSTLATLEAAGVEVRRTDQDGTIELTVGKGGYELR